MAAHQAPPEAYQPAPASGTTADAPAVVMLVPGDIHLRTGGYGYDRAIMSGLRALGWRVELCALDDSFPFPCDEARRAAARALRALPDGALVLADGLAFGAMAADAEREAARLRFVALVHHPLALESGLDAATARALFESERRALRAARGIIVTSRATAGSLAPYGIDAREVAVVPPGTARAPQARGTRGAGGPGIDAPVELLAVASLTPRKGLDVLLAALARHLALPWRLTCAGSRALHPPTAEALAQQAESSGLAGRVRFAGELDEAGLGAAYDRADLFVLPTRHEGYGMAVAEAVARGLPVVSTPTGAIPDLVDPSSGVLVPIDDVDALAQALSALIGDDNARGRLAAGARLRRDALPTWAEAARLMAVALARYADHDHVQR